MAEEFLLPVKEPTQAVPEAVAKEEAPKPVKEQPAFELPEKTKENTLTLTPPEPIPEPINIFVSSATKTAAAYVGARHMMLDVYRGVKQMLGIDEEQMKQEQKFMDALYANPEYGKYAIGGSVAGALAEPVGLFLPAAKGKSVLKSIGIASGIGTGYGGAGYVQEGQTRLGNAALGGTIGATAVGAIKGTQTLVHAKKVREAKKTIDNVELAWARQIAEGVEPTKAYSNLVENVPKLKDDLTTATKLAGRKPKLVLSQVEAKDIVKYYTDPIKQNNLGIGKMADKAVGIMSTRVGLYSQAIKGRMRNYERTVLRNTHENLTGVHNWRKGYSQIGEEEKKIADRALYNQDFVTAERIMQKHGGEELVKEFREQVLPFYNKMGDDLLAHGRITNKLDNYFARVIKDKEGLFNKLGKVERNRMTDALDKAESKAIKRGYGLTPIEEAEVIDQVLKGYGPKTKSKPGFAKQRKIQELSEDLLPFYAKPEEAIEIYIRNSVTDLEKAKFFGSAVKYNKIHGTNTLDVEKSVGELVAQELKAGKITLNQAMELEHLLQVRFGIGEKGAAGLLQDVKNITYSSLLGNPISAATQLGDLGVAIYVNGFRRTLTAAAKSVTGRDRITIEEFGLVDHIAEEMATTRKSAKFLNTTLKFGLFARMDKLGKETLLNGSLSKYQKLAKTTNGQEKIAKKYKDVFEDDYDLLVQDLRDRKVTDRVKQLLFNELSDVQPISKSEMPEMYLRMPNGRVIYMLKTFMLKQLDIVRRDAFQEMAKGNVAKGMKNLMAYGIAVGSTNTAAETVKNAMQGKDVETDMPYDIGVNLIKTFGWSEYVGSKIAEGKPMEAMGDIVLPPYKLFDKLFTEDWAKYMPVGGKLYHYWLDGGIEKFNEKQFAKETAIELPEME